ncbi:2-succinyl-5-enolpyruvyl-6-hydroxy-3-cyclohexene-1-carboxylic-acid synthase [Fluviispira multicolorata]|uniref:2-succinyl-5-enolpyruvyl-6-hydroxy-3-cyclohexene-1-carboxylic-acid synthase n=1 Tax=Fluviispira multicolorata TaxID=2654512 RepID=A0A833JFF9_9BACT|nr:2-succinyl-5-enolpyruvyl-6-hydroxy-3-cyclohexene-1-carboxylic-acid synthase [Fluviispira multicolorata]KAB8033690.1 2-succinyl-5-enolpyruvyl-6-hydroxy-3-cyclohexene-1-carboxylic-acid synthase [Fluviispira multicolorata]
MRSNREFAADIIQQLLDWEVVEFYICAGARNIPLVEILLHMKGNNNFVFNHFEERCAAFYAIGRIKSLKKPVCVITTSGTAVGELLAPTMEAYYSGLPLVLLTADRPKAFRGTGAPQSAEQNNIFGKYVSDCFDIEITQSFNLTACSKKSPLHINACFATPLQAGEIKSLELPINSIDKTKGSPFFSADFIKLIQNKILENKNFLVILSQFDRKFKEIIIDFLCKLNVPIYIESISNLRNEKKLSHLQISCADKIWKNINKADYQIECVIKIGGTPTHRIWRDIEEIYTDIEVISLSDNIFSGHSRAKHFQFVSLAEKTYDSFPEIITKKNMSKECKYFLDLDDISFQNLKKIIYKYPNSEQAVMHKLSNIIPKHSRIYLGNSLSIRHWDLTAQLNQKNFYIEASRGLNGIDGQISTFYGFSEKRSNNFAIIGDLTALYDLSAPWVLQYKNDLNTNLIVINNSGGKIFGRVLAGQAGAFCQNTHTYNLKYWCKMWGLEYFQIQNIDEIEFIEKQHKVYEIFPSERETEEFNKEFSQLN